MSKQLINHVKNILTSFVVGLEISSLIALPAFSQTLPANNPANRIDTNRINTSQDGRVTGGNVTYPFGTRVNNDGIITTPRGERTTPNVTVKRGDGSTTYYYQDGSRINIDPKTVPPTGARVRN